jgi:hypothetical protein
MSSKDTLSTIAGQHQPKKITWWGNNYKDAKDQEAKLGLDLQAV